MYIDTLAREWKTLRAGPEICLKSLYIGGGTPSLLSIGHWERLYHKLFKNLPLDTGYEWTVECNPESLTRDKMKLFSEMGVNRLSIGIQSLNDRELRFLNRPHTSKHIQDLFNYNEMDLFASVALDVMYGLPGQNETTFRNSLKQILSFHCVTHLSVYELTIAPSTPFGRHQKRIPFPEEDTINVMLDNLHEQTDAAGLVQYEVSNFAKPGFECEHNIRYWQHQSYVGIGCAAHSYIHPKRFWNSSDVDEYMRMILQQEFDTENEEVLDTTAVASEMLFLGLRQRSGIDVERFNELTGFEFERWVNHCGLEKLLNEKQLVFRYPYYLPTRESLYFADMMAKTLLP